MSDQSLRILINASLNVGSSIKDINLAIDAIAKHPSLKKLKVQIEVDEKFIQSINKFIASADKLKHIMDDQNKVVSESQDVFKKLDGTITTLTQKVMKNGEVIQKSKTIHDENKKSVQKETDALNEQKISLEELLAEQNRYNKLKNQQTRFDPEGKVTGHTNTYTDGNSLLRVNLDNEQNVIKYTIIDRVETEKLIKTKEELRKKLQELAQVGTLSKQQLGNVARGVNSAFDDDSIKQAKESLSIAQKASEERVAFLQKEYSVSKNQAEQMAKWVKDADRAHYDGYLEKEKREKHLYDLVQDRIRAEKLAYEEDAKRNLANSRVPAGRYIGDSIGTTPTVDKQNIKSMQEYVKSIGGVEAELASMAPKVDKVHGNIQELHYRVKEGGKYWHNYVATMVEATGQTHLMDKGLSDLSSRQLGFGEAMKIALTRIAQWGIATSLIYGSFRQLKEGISYITQLDNSLNEIRIVTGKSQQEVAQLAIEYNKLGKSMSVATADIAKQGADLARQGLNDSQAKERMDAIVKYAKISSISLEDSNKIITASVNGTKAKASELIDLFSYLGDSTSSGADEIGRAFQKTASLAAIAGLDYKKLASYIATVSSVTRESAETIGNSFKSLLSRYQSIKEKGFNTEDATNINQVTKALKAVGDQTGTNVSAIDKQTGQLRNYGDVLDDLSKVWDKLNPKQKEYLQTVLGGTYQADKFAALMNNYNDSIKNYTASLNVAGISNQKFQIWQESSAAKLEKFKAVWEGFWQSTVSSDTLKGIITAGTQLLSVIERVTSTFGFLPPVVGLATAALFMFNKGFNQLILSTISLNWTSKISTFFKVLATDIRTTGVAATWATGSLRGLRVALISLTAATAVGAVIAGLVWGLTELFGAMSRSNEESKRTADSIDNINKKYKEQSDQLTSVTDYYKQNHSAILTNIDVKEQLFQMQNKLLDTFGNEAKGIDLVNGKYDDQIKKIDELNKKQLGNQIKESQIPVNAILEKRYSSPQLNLKSNGLKPFLGMNSKNTDYTIADDPLGEKDKSILQYNQELLKIKDAIFSKDTSIFKTSQAIAENETERNHALQAVNQSLEAIKPLIDKIKAQQDLVKDSIKNTTLEQVKLSDAQKTLFDQINNAVKDQPTKEYEQSIKTIATTVSSFNGSNLAQVVDTLKQIPQIKDNPALINTLNEIGKSQENISSAAVNFEALNKSIENTTKAQSTLASSYETLNKGEALSADAVLELIKSYPALAHHLATTNDLTFNKGELIKQVAQWDRDSRREEAQNALNSVLNTKKELEDKQNLYKQFYTNMVNVGSPMNAFLAASSALTTEEKASLDTANKRADSLAAQIKILSQPLTFFQSGSRKTPKAKKTPAGPSLKDSLVDPLQDQELTKEILASYNRLYDSRQKNIESLDRQIKTAEKAKDEAKTVELTNKKIKEQTASIEDLRVAQQKMHDLADKQRIRAGGLSKEMNLKLDTEKWFDASGNGTYAYGQVLQTLADRSQAIHDNTKLSVKERNAEIVTISKQKKAIEDIFNVLQLSKQGWRANADEIVKVTDNIDAAKESLQQMKIDVDKKAYEKLKDQELKIIDEQINKEDERHQKRVDNIDDEMNKFQDSVDLIRKSINRDSASEDYNTELTKLQKEAQDILNLRNQYALDNSIEGNAKKVDLDKQYADKQDEIQKFQKDRTKQLRENNLDDLVDVKKKEVDVNKKSEDQQYKDNKTSLDKVKVDITNFWETTINDEKTYLVSQSEIIAEHLSKVKGSLLSFFKDTSISKTIGDSLLTGITGAANNVPPSAIPSYSPIGGGSYVPASGSERDKIKQMYDNSQAYKNAPANEKDSIYQINQQLGKSIGATLDTKKGIWSKNGVRLYHEGGEVGVDGTTQDSWLQKFLKKNEVASILQKKEVVLKDPMSFVRDIASRVMPNFDNITHRVSPAGGGDTTFNFDVRIDNLNGGKEGADSFFAHIQRGLKTRKFN